MEITLLLVVYDYYQLNLNVTGGFLADLLKYV